MALIYVTRYPTTLNITQLVPKGARSPPLHTSTILHKRGLIPQGTHLFSQLPVHFDWHITLRAAYILIRPALYILIRAVAKGKGALENWTMDDECLWCHIYFAIVKITWANWRHYFFFFWWRHVPVGSQRVYLNKRWHVEPCWSHVCLTPYISNFLPISRQSAEFVLY